MRCVTLRDGDGTPLFLFPGSDGLPDDFAQLAEAMRPGRLVLAIEFTDDANAESCFRSNSPAASTGVERQSVESMGLAAARLVRSAQPRGPYHLAGYSFGGLVVLEAARALRDSGESVPFIALIDSIYDRRYWPLRLFLAATIRRSARHLRRLVYRRSVNGWSELRGRALRLIRRVAVRIHPTRMIAERPSQGGLPDEAAARNLEAMAKWQPRPVDGTVVLFTGNGVADFGCDPARLWRPWIRELHVVPVRGSHREIVANPANVAALANAMEWALARSDDRSLRVLVAATFAWEFSCRLAVELAGAGCVITAVAPPRSDLHHLDCVTRSYRMSLVRPIMSLRAAILEADPDLIVPVDDRTRHALNEIYARANDGTEPSARLRERIRRSMGSPEWYGQLYSRAATMAVAEASGVRCPSTALVRSAADVRAWMDQHRVAAVIKTDGSWGGREVVLADTAEEAVLAFNRLSKFPRWTLIAKRWIVDRDPWPLRNRLRDRQPAVSIQAFIDGQPANVATACLNGDLLGAVQTKVLRTAHPFGPSTVVRLKEYPEMRRTAESMVRALGVTGFCGFDFVVERGTDHAYLVEVNPRATPTASLVAPGGIDLPAELRRALGRPGPPGRVCDYPEAVVDVSSDGQQSRRPLVQRVRRRWSDAFVRRRPQSVSTVRPIPQG